MDIFFGNVGLADRSAAGLYNRQSHTVYVVEPINVSPSLKV